MPLSGQLCGTADGGVSHLSRFPAAFRLPAFASWSSISRWGIGPSLRSAYRGTEMNPGPNGVVTLRMHEMRPGTGALYTPETVVLSRSERNHRPPPAAFLRPVPIPRCCNHLRG
jgi:hypothetical protein